MREFFQNKQKAFWLFQTCGWIGYGIMRIANGYANGRSLDYIKPSIVAVITGFLLSLIMRSVYRSIKDKPMFVAIGVSVFLSIFFAIIFSTIETIGHVQFYDPFWDPRGLEFLGSAILDVYVLMAWTALYFGINYYIELQQQIRKALASASMAHQAQLKMLRYQLNPHFLFNTLNAISTLVLDKDTKAANGMLRRLSSFLRYTLINQPTQKVTVDQEFYALSLYLDIEKVRFQDRLDIVVKLEEKAKGCLMPSLLLQPLVENAIKYAIAPSENGGCITIGARIEGNRLTLRVADDGPGIGNEAVLPNNEKTGVGVANIKDRLAQIYGYDHAFQLRNVDTGGLEVLISLPVEEDDNETPALKIVED